MMTDAEMVKLALKDGTREGALRLVQQQVDEMVSALNYDEAEARALTLRSIGYYTGYLDHAIADTVLDLFETEHPIFGRTHPGGDEAFKMGLEYAKKRRNVDEPKP